MFQIHIVNDNVQCVEIVRLANKSEGVGYGDTLSNRTMINSWFVGSNIEYSSIFHTLRTILCLSLPCLYNYIIIPCLNTLHMVELHYYCDTIISLCECLSYPLCALQYLHVCAMSKLHTINQSAIQHENDILSRFTLLIIKNGEKRNKLLA